jgi:hypothetical protein
MYIFSIQNKMLSDTILILLCIIWLLIIFIWIILFLNYKVSLTLFTFLFFIFFSGELYLFYLLNNNIKNNNTTPENLSVDLSDIKKYLTIISPLLPIVHQGVEITYPLK